MGVPKLQVPFVAWFGCAALAACQPPAAAPQPSAHAEASADSARGDAACDANPPAELPEDEEPEYLTAGLAARAGHAPERQVSINDNPKLIARLEAERSAQIDELPNALLKTVTALGDPGRYELYYHAATSCLGDLHWYYRRSAMGWWTMTYEEREQGMHSADIKFAPEIPEPHLSAARRAKLERSWDRFMVENDPDLRDTYWVDLNRDGTPETISSRDGACAMHVGFNIYQKVGSDDWQSLGSDDYASDITFINHRTNGFYDIKVGRAVLEFRDGRYESRDDR